jgi:hypothetical protein
MGDLSGNVRLMAAGLFIFGLGVSPLAVVQETIIVRFFKSHGLGVSMAFGLVAGKGASFVSARTSYPLTERFGPHAPFYVATFLTGMSVVINLVYITASRWLIDGAGAELEAVDINEEAQRRSIINMSEAQALEKVAAKRRVHLRQITKLGDVFWAYVKPFVYCCLAKAGPDISQSMCFVEPSGRPSLISLRQCNLMQSILPTQRFINAEISSSFATE